MEKASENKIKFGTDGWRAVISDTFTFKNVQIVAQAAAQWVNQANPNASPIVAVGFDNRFLSAEYAQTFAQVLAANNIKVYLSDTSLPTPALSYGVTLLSGVAGIMITASHNPAKFNGIKIKTAQGGAAPQEITAAVEGLLGQSEVKTGEGTIIVHDFKKCG